ncbi:hypothetical protein BCR33DRAFT_713159 [Rhizoclosmatium globosum]|uniref:Uncharacterized protein n=1 Tax=Rhizoclosmatium globosum TaxID=329046 RepID=A0A1Y2CTJ5_9FUNG|nr:hypothetical protein BCR33DRAFT_713159 [Rhizoclosmatium globosum]|eukprot:ORY50343.1 hypothetical protein BCR33DRAFT_713159 [Rhizoclosmatium globosum]
MSSKSAIRGRKVETRENRLRGAHPIDRVVVYQTALSPLIITKNEATNTIQLSACAMPFLFPHTIAVSVNAILSCFSSTRSHPHRLTYCTAGLMFRATSPLPYGGSKQSPGYSEFLESDNSNNQLLEFLVHALNFLVESVNKVLALQVSGEKDVLDELLMKGMKKSGQIPWFGPAQIPAHLTHQFEEQEEGCVYFTPARLSIKRLKSGTVEDVIQSRGSN